MCVCVCKHASTYMHSTNACARYKTHYWCKWAQGTFACSWKTSVCVCVCVCARGCMHMCIHAHICMVSMRVHGTNPLTTDATGTGHFRLQLDFVCDPVHRVTRFDTISSLLQKHQFAVYHLTLVTWDLTPICRFSRPMKGWRNARELLIRIPRYNVDCTSTKPEKIL